MGTLDEQLKVAKKLLEDAKVKLIPDDSFFDAEIGAFESKIKNILYASLKDTPLTDKQRDDVVSKFILKFDRHVMRMTPIASSILRRKK